MERLVKSRRTEGVVDPGEKLMRQLKRTKGAAASTARAAPYIPRTGPPKTVEVYMSVEVATDDEGDAEGSRTEDEAWKGLHR